MFPYVDMIVAGGSNKSPDIFGQVAAPPPMESAMLALGSQLDMVHQGTSRYQFTKNERMILDGKRG